MSRAVPVETLRSSARLGLTLRSIVLTPREGFESAARAIDRRSRARKRPAEGIAPYVLAAVGGSALFVLWLKVGGLSGVRRASLNDYRHVYLFASLVLGALLALIAQIVWAAGAASILGTKSATRTNLRAVWGFSAVPQLATIVILLPLDLMIVGPAVFSTHRLPDPLSTAWAAFSIAVAAVGQIWAVYLLARGLNSVTGAPVFRIAGAVLLSMVLVAALFASIVVLPQIAA